MPRGNFGNSRQHREAGKLSSGNRTSGANRRGGRGRKTSENDVE